jgi:hypothetical protein
MLSLPASTNLKNYHDHVTKVLPTWRKRAKRVLKKHVEDKLYANMRHEMALRIPILKGGLEQISAVQLQDIIAIPWADHKHSGIIEGITALLMKTWSWPLVVYSSWNKVLRENGITVAGVLFGRNLNEDISTQVSPLRRPSTGFETTCTTVSTRTTAISPQRWT